MPVFDLAGGRLDWTARTASIAYTDRGNEVRCVNNGLTGRVPTTTVAPSLRTCAGR